MAKDKKEEKFRTFQVITRIMRPAAEIHPSILRQPQDEDGWTQRAERDQFTLFLPASFIQLLLFVFIPDRPESRERKTRSDALC
jgi:hypothetical protein